MNKISIVIIVKKDKGLLDTLSTLDRENVWNEAEVVIVGDSIKDFPDILKKYPQIRWVNYVGKKQKKIDIPEKRNVGINSTTGDFIIFLDASCRPAEGWLQNLVRRTEEGEDIVAGPVIPSDKSVINNISNANIEVAQYVDECPTANVLIAKKVFHKIGIFDEQFEYGSDTDLMWRAKSAGFKIFFEPKAVVTHDWGKKTDQIKRSYNYGKGRMRFYIKHRLPISRMIRKDPILFFYPIYILLLPLALINPLYLLILFIPVVKNIHYKPLEVTFLNLIYGFGGIGFFLSMFKKRFT